MTTAPFPAVLAARLLAADRAYHASPAGPHNAELRAAVVTHLTGIKTPKSKAGITILQKLLFERFPCPTPSCTAVQEEYVKEQFKKIVAEQGCETMQTA